MPNSLLLSLKPAVKKQVHLLLAGLLWTIMGVVLLGRGVSYIHFGGSSYILIFVGIILGFIKSYLILDKSIRRGLVRIESLPKGSCIGAVYSFKTWCLILFMAVSGILLRHSSLPASYLAVFCCTIGWSLLFSSRLGWRSWKKNRS